MKKILFTIVLLMVLGVTVRFASLTFSWYFIFCSVSVFILYLLLFSKFGKKTNVEDNWRWLFMIPWLITTLASVIVTTSFLHPNEAKVYANVDANVLTLRGVDMKDSIVLVGVNKKTTLLDHANYEGHLAVTPADSNLCWLTYQVLDEPVFVHLNDSDEKKDLLLNAPFLPFFQRTLEIDDGTMKCTIELEEVHKKKYWGFKKVDSLNVTIRFSDSDYTYTSSYHTILERGYNLYDLIHTGIAFTPEEEDFISRIKRLYILLDKKTGGYRITYNNEIVGCRIVCDGLPYSPQFAVNRKLLSPSEYIYIGLGSTQSRKMAFSSDGNVVMARYQFPYLTNFPRSSTKADFKEGERKSLAISSSTPELLKSDVKEAFYYPLFEQEDNLYHFSGFINYKVSGNRLPLKTTLLDNAPTTGRKADVLLGHNNGEWKFAVYDLRKQSPITGEQNWWVNDDFILGVILVTCLLVLVFFQMRKNCHAAGVVAIIWLFVLPLFVLRLYLLWRIAVFPPLSDIKIEQFINYRLEKRFFDEHLIDGPNAMYQTLQALVLLALFSIHPLLLQIWFKLRSQLLKLWFTLRPLLLKPWNRVYSVLQSIWFKTPIPQPWINRALTYIKTNRWMISYMVVWTVLAIIVWKFTLVWIKVVLPVLLFFVIDFICVKKEYSRWWRILGGASILVLLFVGDPGYAVMFFIFLSIYGLINLSENYPELAITLGAGLAIFVFYSANIVHLTYTYLPKIAYIDETFVIICASIIGCTTLCLMCWSVKKKKHIAACSLAFISLILFLPLANSILAEKPHMKYRALVHTETASESMTHESFGQRNSRRLLEASTNQWFIEYHNHLGDLRNSAEGIYSFSPHFKNGVSWGTQISDVIVARYLVGEISSVFPIWILILSGLFVLFMLSIRSGTSQSRQLGYAVAILIMVQMIFVWMAATNRMIFFGQDFPFISHAAKATLLMFIVLLGMTITQMGAEDYEDDEMSKPVRFRLGIIVTIAIALFPVYKWGNRYDKLYADNTMEQTMGKSEYNMAQMINQCKKDLEEINNYLLQTDSITKDTPPLNDDEDVTRIFNNIEQKISLTAKVDSLAQEGRISTFTQSMYNAFRKNLLSHNSISNVIHLKRNQTGKYYEFSMNCGIYTLQSPEVDEKAWEGSIYAEDHQTKSDIATVDKFHGLIKYSIPKSWLPPGHQVGIIDCRDITQDNIHHERILHTPDVDYKAQIPIYPIHVGDILEITSTRDGYSASFRYGMSQEDLLMKNMVINGKHRYFYPLKEKFFWLKDFSEMASLCMAGHNDSVILTLDEKLTSDVYDLLKDSRKTCSVVAMDGLGNVRLMADYRGDGNMLDPNDLEGINEHVIKSYLNPNPVEDNNLFGNMNLLYLNPGPGSSLKPITYAAVTSQSLYFPWQKLKLLPPKVYPDSSITKDPIYWHVKKYGPQYRYQNFQSLRRDELDYDETPGVLVDSKFYLAQSSNYYNAAVTYLGHYGDLKDFNSIFKEAEPLDYPKLSFDGGHTLKAFRDAPENVHSNENGILLMHGLYSNFSIPTYLSYSDTLRYKFIGNHIVQQKGYSPEKLATLFPWVYPSNSFIMDYQLSNENSTPAARLKQYTLGASPIHLTPLKMAEMYGKLLSLHPDFTASITPNTNSFTATWRNRDGGYDQNIWNFYKENLFPGMEECARTGTANVLNGLTQECRPYCIYAKTGTLEGVGRANEDRMLAVIITNQNLTETDSPDMVCFYVLYFYYKDAGTMANVRNIVEAVMNSRSFNQYMSRN